MTPPFCASILRTSAMSAPVRRAVAACGGLTTKRSIVLFRGGKIHFCHVNRPAQHRVTRKRRRLLQISRLDRVGGLRLEIAAARGGVRQRRIVLGKTIEAGALPFLCVLDRHPGLITTPD